MRMGSSRRVLGGVLTLALFATACGGDGSVPADGGTGDALSGSVAISGSSTVQPISSLVAEGFSGANRDVTINVDGPGTGDGFALFCDGATDINDASRPIEDAEAQTCEDGGVKYVELKVGLDGITVMTSPANESVTCLTKADLYALLGPESEGFSTWAEANALDVELGGSGEFPDLPLDISAPGEESGTYDAFIELAGIEGTAIDRGVAEDKAAALRPDYASSPNDNVIIQGMEGSDGSLGFVGFAFADQAGDQVKTIEIDGGNGCVAPSHDSIADATYPLSRSLYIYVNTDNAASNPALSAYVDYYLSDQGIAAVADADYVELPASDLEATRSSWEGAAA
jgi:phosphate transport system substrate-binding protein